MNDLHYICYQCDIKIKGCFMASLPEYHFLTLFNDFSLAYLRSRTITKYAVINLMTNIAHIFCRMLCPAALIYFDIRENP